MTNLIKKPLFWTNIVALFFAGWLITDLVFGWTNPNQNPPGGSGAITVSAGNVGIGIAIPDAKLHVGGDTRWGTRGSLKIDQGASIELGGSGGTPYVDFSNDNSSDYDARIILMGDDALTVDGASVGIGGLPTDKLTINSTDSDTAGVRVTNTISGSTGNDGLRILQERNDTKIVNLEAGKVQFGSNGLLPFTITSSGFIGIGPVSVTPMIGALEIAGNGANQLVVRKISGVNGSVSIFTNVGSSAGLGQGGTAACQALSLTAICLGGWSGTGVNTGNSVGCSTATPSIRVLCADFGD
ncbi:MAG: hypothetical protein HYT03_00750 [Candidatus Harrisonbacteria bacterium]|nr:hypothetical protein [Candidatus Harrisonbacteria bacterium]